MDAFLAVVVVVSLLALVGSVVALATSGRRLEDVGRGGLALGERRTDPPAAAPGELEAEIRQYLGALNRRRVARGEPPLDVEAEVAKRLESG